MDAAAVAFRARAAALRGDRRRSAYPDSLRAEAVAYIEAAGGRGVSLASAAAALGVDKSSLRSWQKQRRGAGLRAVKVIDRSSENSANSAGIVVHGPGGIRVEGLDIASLAVLLRTLS
jgi:transposase